MTEPATLVSAIRSHAFLATGDSLYRALDMLRNTASGTLPVVDAHGQLRGIVALADLLPLLGEPDYETSMRASVADWARPARGTALADMTLDEARRTLAASGETTLFVLDAEGRYIGAASLPDLLLPRPAPPRPPSVGGMATPWGVYLTDGSLQAGAGNLALIGSGVLMGLLLAISYAAIGLFAWGAQRFVGWPLYALWNADAPAALTLHNAGWFLLQGVALLLFLLLMRALPLSGYHAAEHQAVHAMERGEPLCAEILRRMPRVHPRCGTNLMAGGLVFASVSKALPALHIGLGASDSAVLGAIVALFTWRSVGAFLQQHFTTRPATASQIASGIAAAHDLERKYLTSVLRRPNLLRRLWCMGMPQMMAGASVGTTGAFYLLDLALRRLG